ncbi:TetR family transcriptional regulator [Ideonella sp. DXS22W]|uniref:TetR family transcriptional regulator n=1 Tax=Pseudaquabacterium inlustre TaxID=2984192 RepID=A0ABU9CN94_9BURK
MASRSTPSLSSRKLPQQARSSQLVAAILQAAVQVLAREGAQRFTTARVAERAGVSVGSIYQYFPNKAAILFRLQQDEWQATSTQLRLILSDGSQPPLRRLRTLIHAFIRSECEEAAMRTALHDAAPLYRDAPEAAAGKAAGEREFKAFVRALLPQASATQRREAAALLMDMLGAVGQQFSAQPRSAAQIRARADAMADMVSAYLRSLGYAGPD